MKLTKLMFGLLFAVAIIITADSSVFAQEMKGDDKMMKDDKMMAMKDDRPIVAVIYADWCPACRNVDPLVSELKKEYGKKMNFVVFNVSNAETTAEAKAKADRLGLAKFFAANKTKTSTVAVIKADKVVYKTAKNTKKADYEKAFAAAVQ